MSHRYYVFALPLLFAAVSSAACGAVGDLRVTVDERVEFMSILFRLAGSPEYEKGRIPAYAKAVDMHFAPFAKHSAVKLAALLRRKRGVSFDAPMSLAVHVKDASTLEGSVPFHPWPAGLDKRWGADGLKRFLRAGRDFHRVAHFGDFFRKHRPLYAETAKRFRAVLARERVVPWFEKFFGQGRGARFRVALSLLNGPCCYGATLRGLPKEDVYCILGTWTVDQKGVPTFDESYLPTLIHEFCHSYANPIIDAHAAALAPFGKRIFARVEKRMRRQAYGTWQTMMRESLVRAAVVRWVLAHKGMKAARREVRQQHDRGFLWTGKFATLLGAYEKQRQRFPTVNAFMPKVARFFAKTASWVEETVKIPETAAPTVLALVPANGAADVDPATKTIMVTFDRPMKDKAWSVCGGGPNFPKIAGKPAYDEARRVLTVPVHLQANWSYKLWLNVGRFRSFQSSEGVALEPVQLRFRTGASR